MSRQNISVPISVVIAGLAFIVMLFAAPGAQSGRAPRAPLYQGYNNPYTNTQSTDTPTPTQTVTPTQATAQATANATATAGVPTVTVTQAVATLRPTATTQPTAAATLEPTLTPTPSNSLTCIPGQPVEITGNGPPRSGYLLYFDGRVVSGGSVMESGEFRIKLVVGSERPGDYQIVVRDRGTSRTLREITCTVPQTTPTPIPVRRNLATR